MLRVGVEGASITDRGTCGAQHMIRQRRTRPQTGHSKRTTRSTATPKHEIPSGGDLWLTARQSCIHHPYVASLAVAALAGACYLPSLRNQFAFDDRSVRSCLRAHKHRVSHFNRTLMIMRRQSTKTRTCDPRHRSSNCWITISGEYHCARTYPTNHSAH